MLNFDRSTVKHTLQNIQNDCHQWLSHSFRVHQIRFRLELCSGPRWGAYIAPPDPLAGLRGPTSKGRDGRRGKGRGREGGEKGGRRGEGRDFLDLPLKYMVTLCILFMPVNTRFNDVILYTGAI